MKIIKKNYKIDKGSVAHMYNRRKIIKRVSEVYFSIYAKSN